jgi:hypothetical protein
MTGCDRRADTKKSMIEFEKTSHYLHCNKYYASQPHQLARTCEISMIISVHCTIGMLSCRTDARWSFWVFLLTIDPEVTKPSDTWKEQVRVYLTQSLGRIFCKGELPKQTSKVPSSDLDI